MDIHELARQNQQSAWKVLEDTCIIEAWERIGATVRLVGSLRTGLLVKSRDIDIHIYTDRLDVGESFSVIRELAERLPLQEIQYRNLIHTEEECMEWHALYKDREQNTQVGHPHPRGFLHRLALYEEHRLQGHALFLAVAQLLPRPHQQLLHQRTGIGALPFQHQHISYMEPRPTVPFVSAQRRNQYHPR